MGVDSVVVVVMGVPLVMMPVVVMGVPLVVVFVPVIGSSYGRG
jgi:hypothetical protein